MAYIRKTEDEWQIHGYYGRQYGWEEVCAYNNRYDALYNLKLYRESETGYSFKIVKRRVPKLLQITVTERIVTDPPMQNL